MVEGVRRKRGMDAVVMVTMAGFQGIDDGGLGNVPRLGIDFSRLASKWG